ncbi:Protein of unknown function [Actinokineospora iranica]|uniref:DUF3558 domain-containing protein n=1 Tax=Actinokineospora iranica TaxID=1271860 RepID=A0A1G6UU85_9PSEU|nr:Protein of unknown function [Actinokineospora iranica]
MPAPIDATKYLAAPCTVLTPEQLVPFEVNPTGEPVTSGSTFEAAGPSCSWEPLDRKGDFNLLFPDKNKYGLSDYYRERKRWAYFEPIEVGGYPAAHFDVGKQDRRGLGFCGIVVGLTDTLAFSIIRQGGPGPQACDQVRDMAAAALTTMKGA